MCLVGKRARTEWHRRSHDSIRATLCGSGPPKTRPRSGSGPGPPPSSRPGAGRTSVWSGATSASSGPWRAGWRSSSDGRRGRAAATSLLQPSPAMLRTSHLGHCPPRLFACAVGPLSADAGLDQPQRTRTCSEQGSPHPHRDGRPRVGPRCGRPWRRAARTGELKRAGDAVGPGVAMRALDDFLIRELSSPPSGDRDAPRPRHGCRPAGSPSWDGVVPHPASVYRDLAGQG